MSATTSEAARVQRLHRYGILDTPREDEFDAIARHAASVAGTPMAMVSFVEGHRQWFKSEVGLGLSETPRDWSFCQHAIVMGDLWVVPDATLEPLVADSPLVRGEQGVRFYAGAVIETPDGAAIGTVCVLDRQPRTIEPVAADNLRFLARHVTYLLEARLAKSSGPPQGVADRKAREARLREQAMLLDLAQDAILVRDLDHRILYWNRSAERIYGWTQEEVLGGLVHTFLYDDTTRFREASQRVRECGEWKGVLDHLTRDGKRVYVMARWSLVRDEAGRPTAVLAINTDITEQRRLEQQVLRSQRLESIGALAGGIAHDLNNVLAPILMAVSALIDEETDELKREDLAVIERSAERGANMVRQLLQFARGREGRLSLVRIADIAAEVYRMVRDTLPKSIEVRLEVARDIWDIQADAAQIHQLLTNLCVNARDAMPDGGVLTIAAECAILDEVYAEMNIDARTGPHVLLRVEDTGLGMSPEVLERIYEPFFTTKGPGLGTGLGLPTVHAITRGHHGFINVYSEPGKGTRFKIYLPAEVPAELRDQIAADLARVPRGHGELVLVVDDEEAIRTVTSRTLERYGYRVVTATNGAEAVAKYAQSANTIDVVVTDMAMPVMDGPAMIIALRLLDPKVRIIGSSGLTDNGHVVKAIDAGTKYFVAKPYTAEALLRVIRRILVEPQA